MISAPLRRRLGLVAAAGLLAGGLGAIAHASAGPAPDPAVDPVVANISDDYWACLALDHIDVGMCLKNPLPDLSGAETPGDVVRAVLDQV